MNIKEHTTPEKLEKYSFLWSEIRLLIAALALFLGGVPPLNLILGSSNLSTTILTIAWIVSGLAVVYLFWRWWKAKTLFGAKDRWDTVAFFVMVVSGINLGLTGILSRNIGMGISSNKIVFIVVGILYLAAAYRLYKRWQANGEKLF